MPPLRTVARHTIDDAPCFVVPLLPLSILGDFHPPRLQARPVAAHPSNERARQPEDVVVCLQVSRALRTGRGPEAEWQRRPHPLPRQPACCCGRKPLLEPKVLSADVVQSPHGSGGFRTDSLSHGIQVSGAAPEQAACRCVTISPPRFQNPAPSEVARFRNVPGRSDV